MGSLGGVGWHTTAPVGREVKRTFSEFRRLLNGLPGIQTREAGAQDFEPTEEGSTLFLTETTDMDAVCKALPEQGFTVVSAQFGYLPKNPVSGLSAEEMADVEAFLEAIDGHDDVQNVFVGLAG